MVSACLTIAGFGEVGSEKGETEAREISRSIRTRFRRDAPALTFEGRGRMDGPRIGG